MNDQLAAEIVKIVTKINSGVESAGGFLKAELPDVVTQLLWWHGVQSFLLMLFGLISFYLIYRIVKFICTEVKKKSRWLDNEFTTAFGGAFGIIGGVGWVIVSVCLIFDFTWLKIWIAPRLWLMEYAAGLIK